MDGLTPFILIGVIALLGRFAAGRMDDERIRNYFGERGWTILTKEWAPFGVGFWGDKNRIYRVSYRDEFGHQHCAVVKTSMMAGVFLSEDVITQRAREGSSRMGTRRSNHGEDENLHAELARLRSENEGLRARIAELERSGAA